MCLCIAPITNPSNKIISHLNYSYIWQGNNSGTSPGPNSKKDDRNCWRSPKIPRNSQKNPSPKRQIAIVLQCDTFLESLQTDCCVEAMCHVMCHVIPRTGSQLLTPLSSLLQLWNAALIPKGR